MYWLFALIAYIGLGIFIFFWSIRKDYSGSWAMFPIVIPLIVFGYPVLYLKKWLKG